MNQRLLNLTELDERLRGFAEDLETYDERAAQLAREVDAQGLQLELPDPSSWRREPAPGASTNVGSIEDQFRGEVALILTQSREEEAALARRIEFARLLLDLALERAGLEFDDLSRPRSEDDGEQGFPEEVLSRWNQLHSLRTELVERNLYLVLINVERYAHTRVSRMDLIQEGSSVLFRAVDGFDWRRGLLFRTYAVHWLNQAFRSFLYNFGQTVRVPVYLQKAMKHVHDAIDRLGDKSASVEDIAREAEIAETIVESALGASKATRSIDSAFGADEGDGALRDLIAIDDDAVDPYEPTMEEISVSDGVEMALERLSPREKFVIGLRFGLQGQEEHTLAQIASRLGVSLERVRQIQVRAMSKMNTPKLRKAIDPFLL